MKRQKKMTKTELEALSTSRLNALRKAIYKCDRCLNEGSYGYDGECYHPSVEDVKQVLNTREHLPKKQ